jgi:hypothetical protein
VEAWASLGMDETDRRSVIAGGVTAANFPHLFKNSRRASESSRPSGNSGEPLTEASNQDVTRGPILSRLQLSDIATKAVAIPHLLRLTNLLMPPLPSQLTRISSQAREPPKVPRISDQCGRPKAVNTFGPPLTLPSVSQSPFRSCSTPRQGRPYSPSASYSGPERY